MTPVKATKEEKLLVLGDRVVGIANNLTEAGIPCKFSVVFGKFTFNLDTTRLADKSKPSKRGKKCPNKSRRDKQRRIEFLLRKKQPFASRLETGMKCFQRQVETTDKRVEKN